MTRNRTLAGTVHHVSFRVDNLEQALFFYESVLGCKRIPRPNIPVRGAWLQAGDTQIHLIETPASEETGTPPSQINPVANHVAFLTEDLEETEKHLKIKGFPVSHGPSTDVRQIFVRDPTGNLIEFAPA